MMIKISKNSRDLIVDALTEIAGNPFHPWQRAAEDALQEVNS